MSVSGISISGIDAGNYNLTSDTAATIADIAPKALSVTASSVTKTYDGTTSATGDATVSALATGDAVKAAATLAFTDENAGTDKTVQASGLTIEDAINADMTGNYTISYISNTASTITKAALAGSITASDKVYDGTTEAAILTRTLSGVIGDDVVSYLEGTATFSDKAAADGKTVTATGLILFGTDSGNYTVNDTATATANITKRDLVVTAASDNKVYDGTTAATVTLSDNRVINDSFTTSKTSADFIDKNVGTGKTVTVLGISISDADAGNYNLTSATISTTANIMAKELTVTGITADNKVYDGTTTATLNTGSASLSGVIVGDIVTLDTMAATGPFADKNVGDDKTVTVSGLTLNGDDAGNYALIQPTTTADITPSIILVQTITNQLSNLLIPRPSLSSAGDLGRYQFNSFTGQVYFYHPVVAIDSSAFDDIILDEGAYEFIEGTLKFKKSLPLYYSPTS